MSELQQEFIGTRIRYVKDIFDINLNYVGTIDDFKIETDVQDERD